MMQENDDDLPQSASEVSKALREALARADISDLELFFKCHRIRNLQKLRALDTDEQAHLLSRAMQFWESLGYARSLLNAALPNILFASSSDSATTSNSVPQGVPAIHNKNSHNISSSSSQFWQQPLQAGEVGGRDHHHQWQRLLPVSTDENKFTSDLAKFLWDVRHIVGVSRYNDAISRLNTSNMQISSSVLEAAQALSALIIRKDEDRRGRDGRNSRQHGRPRQLMQGHVLAPHGREAVQQQAVHGHRLGPQPRPRWPPGDIAGGAQSDIIPRRETEAVKFSTMNICVVNNEYLHGQQ
jgi:hypothetical protein